MPYSFLLPGTAVASLVDEVFRDYCDKTRLKVQLALRRGGFLRCQNFKELEAEDLKSMVRALFFLLSSILLFSVWLSSPSSFFSLVLRVTIAARQSCKACSCCEAQRAS